MKTNQSSKSRGWTYKHLWLLLRLTCLHVSGWLEMKQERGWFKKKKKEPRPFFRQKDGENPQLWKATYFRETQPNFLLVDLNMYHQNNNSTMVVLIFTVVSVAEDFQKTSEFHSDFRLSLRRSDCGRYFIGSLLMVYVMGCVDNVEVCKNTRYYCLNCH